MGIEIGGCSSGTTTDVAAIKAVTDNLPDSGALTSISDVTDALPDSGALTSISDETEKIDGATTLGLAGTNNSLAYRAHEIERHIHSYESWFGAAVTPNAEIHVADRIAVGVGVFQADAGNNTWGSWLQILGSSDTPARGTNVKYDLHRIMLTAVERNGAIHFVQLAFGDSGAAALSAEDYTEFVFEPATAQAEEMPLVVQMRRISAGTKAWLRIHVPGQDTGTMDFFIGVHEYEG